MLKTSKNTAILIGSLILVTGFASAADFYVAPNGRDTDSGSRERPFATLQRAQRAVRAARDNTSVTVYLRGGTYYLPETLVFTPEDSGKAERQVVYTAMPGETAVLSGGVRMELKPKPFRNGVIKAKVPSGLWIDQLFVNGNRQRMARYPDYNPNILVFNGYSKDAFSPERAARWKNPVGGYIHTMHRNRWGGFHYRITGKKADNTIEYEGGWQNNRRYGMHKEHRFVENIFEELNAPGEWFYDTAASSLYFYPEAGTDMESATIEVVRLAHLIEFNGTQEKPVKFISLKGLTFRHTARTFMDNKEPLLRSDWTIYRGGAIIYDGAEDCRLSDCEFDQVGGNAVFVNNYNRRILISGCYIHDAGANGVAFVGDPKSVRNPLFEYSQRQHYNDIDKTPGPQNDNYPADCIVEDSIITRVGCVEKQSAGVQVSMAMSITLRELSIYEVPRAGINISEGTFGGHVIEFCDVFDTVRETGDHGSFNSWGRDRFWKLEGAPERELPELARLDMVKPNIIRNSRWRCDHGWDIDLDDGSSNYHVYNNLCLRGGIKNREGFNRRVYNNVIVNNTFHPHVWYDDSQDVFVRNIVMGSYRPRGGMPDGKWGKEVDYNLFTTSAADKNRFAKHGCDEHSIVGNSLFVDPVNGDYRVRDGSPALKLGFENFPMDAFGVQKDALKAIVRKPQFPLAAPGILKEEAQRPAAPFSWLGARFKNLVGMGEISATGMHAETGVLVVDVPEGAEAAKAGFRRADVILKCDGMPIHDTAALRKYLGTVSAGQPMRIVILRDQRLTNLTVSKVRTGDWPHWRGPYFNGSTDEKNLPSDWSRTDNIVWAFDLAGSSAATPIIWGDRVFLSGVDSARDMLLAMCFDRTSGKPLWQHDVAKGTQRDIRSTFAASSSVTDGRVVVFFYSNGELVCFDMNGRRQWARNICDDYGPFEFLWTFGSSPTLFEGRLYIQVLQRDVAIRGRGFEDKKNESYVLAMDPGTGKTLWRQIRPSKGRGESREAYSTPIPFSFNGNQQLLIVGGDVLTGHDLKTGKELWRWGTWNPRRITHWRLVPSPVTGDGIVLACAPKGYPIYAIRPGGVGVLDESAIAWVSTDVVMEVSSDVPTPAYYDGDFFVLNDLRKHLSRVEPRTGKVKWTIQTPGRAKYEASPLAADGKIYIINHAGEVAVIDAANGDVLSLIPMDQPSGREVVRASISAAHGQLFIRTTRRLYCVGK